MRTPPDNQVPGLKEGREARSRQKKKPEFQSVGRRKEAIGRFIDKEFLSRVGGLRGGLDREKKDLRAGEKL